MFRKNKNCLFFVTSLVLAFLILYGSTKQVLASDSNGSSGESSITVSVVNQNEKQVVDEGNAGGKDNSLDGLPQTGQDRRTIKQIVQGLFFIAVGLFLILWKKYTAWKNKHNINKNINRRSFL